MKSRIFFSVVITVCLACVLPNVTSGQTSLAELQKLLSEKVPFTADEFSQLQQGETVVKVFPTQDQREVAVGGVVRVNVVAKEFLRSYREIMARKSNAAILEIGSFSRAPNFEDLQTLTLENRDIDDLKECVIGRCPVKLSGRMIERFQREIDWQAPDYRLQVTNLFKQMLLEYVGDYLVRGEPALIDYVDQTETVRVAEEQRALIAAATYFPNTLIESANAAMRPVETAIVWSKMDLGLKPVITINQIDIYAREVSSGPQVLIVSKQIYANHYFDSSLALTTFLRTPDGSSYLYYENRSRADGLGGVFGKMKRGIVERKAVNGLRGVLDHTRLNLNAHASFQAVPETSDTKAKPWTRWRFGAVHLLLGVVLITGLTALLMLSSFGPKSSLGR